MTATVEMTKAIAADLHEVEAAIVREKQRQNDIRAAAQSAGVFQQDIEFEYRRIDTRSAANYCNRILEALKPLSIRHDQPHAPIMLEKARALRDAIARIKPVYVENFAVGMCDLALEEVRKAFDALEDLKHEMSVGA